MKANPEPGGYLSATVKPAPAYYHLMMKEFVLPYEVVRTAKSPGATLLDFLQSSYEAGANPSNWDRAALERSSPGPVR